MEFDNTNRESIPPGHLTVAGASGAPHVARPYN